jgi:Tfp pilus assembly protein PilO
MNKNKNSSIVTLVLLVVLIAVGIFWFKPNWDDTTALKLTETAREDAKVLATTELEGLKEAQTNLAGAGEIERATILTSIPEKYEQDKLINIITEIARKNDVNIGSISFSAPLSSQETVKTATISLSMTGGESDLLRLLKGIENSPRKMIVKNITVQFGQTEGYERVNFSISMETFFQTGI